MMMTLEKDTGAVQQPPMPNYNEIIMRQLERLEQRFEERFSTLEQRMRSDIESLRKELVARDSLEPQMNALSKQIERVDIDRGVDRTILEKRIEKLETDQISRQDRLWIRLGQIMSVAAFLIALFELLSHVKWLP